MLSFEKGNFCQLKNKSTEKKKKYPEPSEDFFNQQTIFYQHIGVKVMLQCIVCVRLILLLCLISVKLAWCLVGLVCNSQNVPHTSDHWEVYLSYLKFALLTKKDPLDNDLVEDSNLWAYSSWVIYSKMIINEEQKIEKHNSKLDTYDFMRDCNLMLCKVF